MMFFFLLMLLLCRLRKQVSEALHDLRPIIQDDYDHRLYDYCRQKLLSLVSLSSI